MGGATLGLLVLGAVKTLAKQASKQLSSLASKFLPVSAFEDELFYGIVNKTNSSPSCFSVFITAIVTL